MLIPNWYTDQDQPIAIRINIHRKDGLEDEGESEENRKKSTGLVRWLYHKDRAITVRLQRLRSGHNYLNAFSNRIDQGADPSCRKGCEEIENVKHVLVDCQVNELHRNKLRYLFSAIRSSTKTI
uniref:Uncharacterized protein n=1 Tax=Daphnia galeata TaxID=27404 RepID=A0A8J2RVW3_9CRUS|nr:unnamed protein product [Daphnia galeata]